MNYHGVSSRIGQMNWNVFYNDSCALQNSENQLALACRNTSHTLNFAPCKKASGLPKGSLFLDESGELFFIADIGENPFSLSWSKNLNFWSRENFSFKKSPLLRALGARAGQWVVDATCGTGQDCAYLLSAGLKVRAYERFFPTYLLLKYSLLRESPNNLELFYGSYTDSPDHWDCPVYYDPMFDDGTKRKAKSNKQMSLFHGLLKDQQDDSSQVAAKLLEKTGRLVVKRAPKGELLLAKAEGLNAQWSSKAVRFDLYLN